MWGLHLESQPSRARGPALGSSVTRDAGPWSTGVESGRTRAAPAARPAPPPARPGPRPGSRCTPACRPFSRLSMKGCPGITPSGHFIKSCVSKLFGYLRIDLEVDDTRTTTLVGTRVTSWWQVTCWHGSLPDGSENDARSGRVRRRRSVGVSGSRTFPLREPLFITNPGGRPARVTADM